MKLKNFLRVVCRVIFWFSFGSLIALRASGESTIIINIGLVAGCINIITYIIKYVFEKISYDKYIKNFKRLFYYMSISHKERYRCLLSGDINSAKEYEELISCSSEIILKHGSSILEKKEVSSKDRKEIQEIMDKTKILLNTTLPPV